MKDHVVADHPALNPAVSSQAKADAPVAVDDQVVLNRDVSIAPEMNGMLGYLAAGAGDVFEGVAPDDPAAAVVAINSADVVLRADPRGVLEQAALDEPVFAQRATASRAITAYLDQLLEAVLKDAVDEPGAMRT